MSNDIDPEDIRPGDIVRLEDSDSDWRVIEPVEQRETAMYSGRLIAMCIQGSPSLGGWKPARKVVDHSPRGAEFQTPDDGEQSTLAAVTGGD